MTVGYAEALGESGQDSDCQFRRAPRVGPARESYNWTAAWGRGRLAPRWPRAAWLAAQERHPCGLEVRPARPLPPASGRSSRGARTPPGSSRVARRTVHRHRLAGRRNRVCCLRCDGPLRSRLSAENGRPTPTALRVQTGRRLGAPLMLSRQCERAHGPGTAGEPEHPRSRSYARQLGISRNTLDRWFPGGAPDRIYRACARRGPA